MRRLNDLILALVILHLDLMLIFLGPTITVVHTLALPVKMMNL